MLSISPGGMICLLACCLASGVIGTPSKFSLPLVNTINLHGIDVGVGDPPNVHRLAIALGISNTLIGAEMPYVPTRSTVDLNRPFQIDHMYGNASGKWVNDTISLGSGTDQIVLPNIMVGDVSSGSFIGFGKCDGMFTLNRVGDTAAHPENESDWTPMSYMWHRNLLEQNVFSLSFKPTRTLEPEQNGMITFGGIEPSLFIGKLYWYSCKSNTGWDWTVTISYGGKKMYPTPLMAALDPAWALGPCLANDIFQDYIAGIPGSIWDYDDFQKNNPIGSVNRHVLKIPKTSVSKMKDLCFTAADKRPWCLTPEAQLLPEDMLPDPTYRYSYITPIGSTVEQGSTIVMGMKGLERFYSVYDRENYRVNNPNLITNDEFHTGETDI
ncbi:aspartic peptidase A1 [Melampsora larici-populina 98AG31]|uniref:Aspartic peptidase A1 n=1 Tax=Melampsora larici-populina (strain 98AG31 / pathotype 3-4-7) TaxID=747676 RepID=F4RIK7_MELLP|nr:aspartic peptidase A1 [Melampsora larici-populina 98AG31]EGG07584.1 aspartic peptidase A1 [Melampsora larici-populina 98AG31]